MKKIFTLLALMVLSMTAWAAGETFTVGFDNAAIQSRSDNGTDDYFSVVSASYNSSYACKYDGVEYKKPNKLGSTSAVNFTTAAVSTITIVMSTARSGEETNYPKFDGTKLSETQGTALSDADNDKVYVFTLTDVAPGSHSITRSAQAGLVFVKVEYTGEVKTALATPEITFNATTGEVTIGAVANATEVRYTTDGSTPDEMTGDVYGNPFTVADGTVVKAIAIGTGSYINSDVASKQVLIEGTVPVAPTITSQAGAVGITCATPAVTIEYSTNGTDYQEYSYAFYLATDATVYARAKRGDKTSEVTQFAFKAVPQPNDVATVKLEIPDGTNSNSYEVEDNTLTYTLAITGNAGKNYSLGSKITIDGSECNTAKLSNGAQNTLTLPAGKKAVRLTLYSYVNAASTSARTSGWSEVNGVSYDVKEAPMGAFTNVEGYAANPDVRSYLIDGQNTVTFTNTGEQLCFYAVVDIATDTTIIPTAISEVKAADAAADAPAYNLAGQKVDAAFKGIVIKNGKKVLNK